MISLISLISLIDIWIWIASTEIVSKSSYLRYYEFVKVNNIGETVIFHGLVDTVGECKKGPIVPEYGPVLEVLLQAPLHHVQVYPCFIRWLLKVAKEIGNSAGDLEKVEPGYCWYEL